MKTVNISDLKAQLSAHIQYVREGEEVLVCERNVPVARITPVRLEEHSEQERRLIARGVLAPSARSRAGRARRDSSRWPGPPGDVSDKAMEQVWKRERGSR